MNYKKLLKLGIALSFCATVWTAPQTVRADTAIGDAQIAIDEKTFVDENLRAVVSEQADTNQDGMLSEDEIQKVTSFVIEHPHQPGHRHAQTITCDVIFPGDDRHDYDGIPIDFTGIELFSNLEMIGIHNVEPLHFPFEKLPNLREYYLSSAPASEQDFSKAEHLKTIGIVRTKITKLNLKDNASLKNLQLRGCGLAQADFSGCRNLQHLWLDYNQLKSINLTKNSQLKSLHLEHNKLSALDLSKNKKLEEMDISSNHFKKIDKNTLKVSNSGKLSAIYAFMLEKCRLLDVSHISSLKKLDASSGKFTKIKIGKNLLELSISSGLDRTNPMTVLDAKTLKAPSGAKLKVLECYQGNLKKLDTSHLKNLKKLLAEDNQLTKVNLSKNLKMQYCELYGNPLKQLIVSKKSNEQQKKMYQKIVKKNGGTLVYK